jgi:tripartite-type tricarboxylate transporter receptor subunit TctC
VPYKGGADALNDLIAGRVHFYASPTLAVLPQARAGRIRLLAVTSPERLAVAPDVPTLVEKGLPFVRYGWLGVCAGAGTPPPVIARLNREIGAIVLSAEYKELIEKAGSLAVSSTPDELARILAETYEQTARVAREFGLQL